MKHLSLLVNLLLEFATEYNKCSTSHIWVLFGRTNINTCHKVKIIKIPMEIIFFDEQTSYKMLFCLPFNFQLLIYFLMQFAKLAQLFWLGLHYSFISQNYINPVTVFYIYRLYFVSRMIKKILPFPITILVVAILSYAIGGESKLVFGVPLIWLLNIYCFAVQIVAFIPASIFQTQKFYDLTGSLTYLSTVGLILYFNNNLNNKQKIAATLIVIWALRLGTFLFKRVLQKGCDSRFDVMKKKPFRFFFAWFFQGLWTVITPCPLLIILTKNSASINSSLNTIELIGLSIWILGFIFECVADYQKSVFNSLPQNKGKFIKSGVWSISRHPNYAGQIILWFGVSVFAFSNLNGWQYVSLISPIFVYLLLTKLSGVPLLEKQALERWGKDSSYLEYKRNTPMLFPFVSSSQQVQKQN